MGGFRRWVHALLLAHLRPDRNCAVISAAPMKLFQATHVRTGVESLFRAVEWAPDARGWLMRDTRGRISGPVWCRDLARPTVTEGDSYPST